MNPKCKVGRLLGTSLAVAVAGTLIGGGCDVADLEALVVGVNAAADHLEGEDDDISFGDWLRDELEDL